MTSRIQIREKKFRICTVMTITQQYGFSVADHSRMELDQEELVKLIFGAEEPDNWKENPDFLLYLSELGNIGENMFWFSILF